MSGGARSTSVDPALAVARRDEAGAERRLNILENGRPIERRHSSAISASIGLRVTYRYGTGIAGRGQVGRTSEG